MKNLQTQSKELDNISRNVNVSTAINGVKIASVRPNNFNQLIGYTLLGLVVVVAVDWIQTIK